VATGLMLREPARDPGRATEGEASRGGPKRSREPRMRFLSCKQRACQTLGTLSVMYASKSQQT
jgi:hypothetical protein